jgi:hypothetical protein
LITIAAAMIARAQTPRNEFRARPREATPLTRDSAARPKAWQVLACLDSGLCLDVTVETAVKRSDGVSLRQERLQGGRQWI